MADLSFIVKNGLTVNGSFTANSTVVNASAISATSVSVGNSTVNAAITSSDYQIANSTVSFALGLPTAAQYANGTFFLNANGDWSEVSTGGLFRINANTLTANITITAGDNAQVTGPISIANGVVLTIDSDSRVVVI